MTTDLSSFIKLQCINPDHLSLFSIANQEKYLAASPFAHICIDNFLKEEFAEGILNEFDTSSSNATYYHHFNEKKRGFTDMTQMGPVTQQVIRELNSGGFLKILSELTGIPQLISDPSLDGGGLHEMKQGGFLNIHTDFQSHTIRKNWSRRCNLLVFLNKDWKDEYNGFLELWDQKIKTKGQKIKPMFNRCVIFNTTDTSWHGVPEILNCPEGRSRKSMALYYFKEEAAVCQLKPTNYQPRPEDSFLKRILIDLDRTAVGGYSFLKRYLGGSRFEKMVSALLKKFSK